LVKYFRFLLDLIDIYYLLDEQRNSIKFIILIGINNRRYQLYISYTNCYNYFKVSTLNKCTIVDTIVDTNYYW